MSGKRSGATIAWYFELWLAYLRVNWLSLMAYNVDFVLSNISNLVRNLASILAVGIIFQHVGTIAGWTFEQILYLYALAATGRGLWHLLLVNVMSVGAYVRNGSMDRLMVRPANILFQLVADYLDNDDWGEAAIGLAAIVYSAGRLGLVSGPADVLMIALQVLSAVAIYFALHLAANTLSFWLVKGRAADNLVWETDNFSRYPLSIYPAPLRAVLTWLVPFGFVSYYPAQAFFGTGALVWLGRLSPLAGALAFGLAYRFWLYGLSHYQGTGS